MKRTTFKEFRKKAFKNSEVIAEYDALAPAYQLGKKLIVLRIKSGAEPGRAYRKASH